MPIDRRALLLAAGLALPLAGAARARQWGVPSGPMVPQWPPAERFRLWPGKPPGAPERLPAPISAMNGPANAREPWLRGVAEPHVGVFRPERPDGRAVLVLPGGGYNFISAQREGIDVAAALTPHGITCFVLAYRLPAEGWANRADVPLQDAQRAMRLIRARAAAWGIAPERLGVLGFSAGGHLGAMLAVGHADAVHAAIDAADGLSARPAYAGLVHPVVDFAGAGLDSRSAATLLGPQVDPPTLARHTPAARVAADTPPVWLAHAADDRVVPIAQSRAMIAACERAGVPVEAHLLERGGHGFGARRRAADLPGRFARWTAALQGLLGGAEAAPVRLCRTRL